MEKGAIPFFLSFVTLCLWVPRPGSPSSVFAGTLGPVPEISAVKIPGGSIHVDGSLDEPEWKKSVPAAGFVQRNPHPGERASQETEVRVLYDDENLYLGVLLQDPEPEKILATQMKRDAEVWDHDDTFTMIIDPHHDHRNGFYFITNPLGMRGDALFFDEGDRWVMAWNPLWWSAGKVTEKGWQLEIRIPFRSLRFEKREAEQRWGITFRRIIRRTNEEANWSPIPIEDEGPWRLALAGHLTGLSGITQGRQIEIKPYFKIGGERISSRGESDWTLAPAEGVEATGVDLKVGPLPNLTVDATLNTDFAQVEVDEQQIDLGGFSLFFPEKREFFLEAKGNFDFGISGEVEPFFSRRIGLVTGQEVPLLGGIKLTGKLARTQIGILSIQTEEEQIRSGEGLITEPAAHYSVLRVSQDILARSDLGLVLINKAPRGASLGQFNTTVGLDAHFSFFKNLTLTSFLLRTEKGREGRGG